MAERKKIAIVVQRYGQDVLGGSETLARTLAHCLADHYEIDVLTTCAKDYVTWENEFPEGDSADGEVRVRRFKVDRPRSRFFNVYNALLLRLPHTRRMEELWMRMQGPCSAGLLRHIAENARGYHLFLFVTYAYAPAFFGLKAVADKAVLIPTAHDEPCIRLGIYRDLFRRAGMIIYLTAEEKSFVDGLFHLDQTTGPVIGAPVRVKKGDEAAFCHKHGIAGDFLLYVGRIDEQKGVARLIGFFERYVAERSSALKLVLCGSGPLDVSRTANIVPLGFVPEEEKYAAMGAALASVLPSRFESYSIVAIESMLCGTPVLVNGESSVLRGHCERGGGGLCFETYDEFAAALDRLRGSRALRKEIGASGKVYAEADYSVEAVRKKYISSIDGLIK